jgi:hypothetical protein
MISEAGVAAAVQALVEGRRGHDVPQAALERQVECTRTQPIRNRTHSETYSTFGQRTDVNFACKSSRLRATTEHPPEIASPPQRTIDHNRARQQSRLYRRPGVGKTTLVNSILRILAAKNASLS